MLDVITPPSVTKEAPEHFEGLSGEPSHAPN